ncbi:sugar ABC transporter permease [Thiospirochaeta perfilievii]|uniref:Sugar ABC transporter permease n=1 Tax=Thiospirochaeta perfilievii TaxID=252967 RepID=A0A5C1QFK6_9SPIO|nr:sugar ABC transporter permease [Thiospirochaeta perfilievii]QEN06301.1 sugar ABC transporter permease [Thiospirochaeta perfilievii]
MSFEIVAKSLSQIGITLALILIAFGIVEAVIFLVYNKVLKAGDKALTGMLLAPAVIGLFLLIVIPLIYELVLSFSNMNLHHFKDPSFGITYFFDNIKRVFTTKILKKMTFWPLLFQTVLWTAIQVTFHVVLGLMLALILNSKIRFKELYKGILILPWAMPPVISGLTWRGEFHSEYGFFNIILRRLFGDAAAIPWMTDGFWNFVAMNITNIWMGVPFMMVICLGALQGVPSEYYEAAAMDGAGKGTRLFQITIPLIKPVLAPSVMLGIIWTFNNFNVPYFINQFMLETSDILVTALYRAAFTYNQYGFAAAFALVIFFILFGISIIYMKKTGALKAVGD